MASRHRQIVAVDLDNVISSTDSRIRAIIEVISGVRLSQEQIRTWEYRDALVASGVDPSAAARIERGALQRFHDHDCASVEPIDGAIGGLRRLQEASIEITVVTGRPSTMTCETLTVQWLRDAGIRPDMLVMGRKKVDAVAGWSYLIDGSPREAWEIAERGVRVLLVDYPWNRSIRSHRLITRVATWHEIPDAILPRAASACVE